jgi:hypothetical protein
MLGFSSTLCRAPHKPVARLKVGRKSLPGANLKRVSVENYPKNLLRREIRKYCTLRSGLINNPYFVTGFVEGESCFSIEIIKSSKIKLG